MSYWFMHRLLGVWKQPSTDVVFPSPPDLRSPALNMSHLFILSHVSTWVFYPLSYYKKLNLKTFITNLSGPNYIMPPTLWSLWDCSYAAVVVTNLQTPVCGLKIKSWSMNVFLCVFYLNTRLALKNTICKLII